MRKAFTYTGVFVFVILLVIFFINLRIINYSKEYHYQSVEEIPKNKVGLLLGTSQYRKGGGENLYFKFRVEAAVRLFLNGKIDYILVSGDNAELNYNEPRDLRRALEKAGVPTDRIVLDFAGFRTLDSVLRAKKVFGQESFTIITQNSHNDRALFLARKNGISAIGFDAQTPKISFRLFFRETLAKTKAYMDVFNKKAPKFLGDPIEIG